MLKPQAALDVPLLPFQRWSSTRRKRVGVSLLAALNQLELALKSLQTILSGLLDLPGLSSWHAPLLHAFMVKPDPLLS